MTMRLRTRAAALAVLTLSAVSLQAQARGLTDADVLRMSSVGGIAIAPAGDRILYTVTGWEHPNAKADTVLGDKHDRRSHIWVVPFAGGTARQLTFAERGESQPAWSPDGKAIAFVSARGVGTGDDAPKPQVWLLPADGGEARQLTSLRDGAVAFAWSPDASRIAVLTPDTLSREQEARVKRRDDAKVFESDFRLNHIWVVTVAGGAATKVTSGAFTVRGMPSWSPDGTKLAFDASPTPMIRDERRDAYVVDVATQRLDKITTAGEVQSTPQFSPDGRTLAFTTLRDEFKPHGDSIAARTLRNDHLVSYDVATKAITDLSQPAFDVSAGQPRWSADGSQLWFSASDRVYNTLYSYTLATKRYTAMTKDLMVQSAVASKDGSKMAFVMDSPQWPGEVFVQDASLPQPKRITTTNAWLTERTLGETRVIAWKSSDGKPVEGILLLPVGYQAGTRVPTVISAHGGPTGAHTNGFKGSTGGPGQTWAARGWAVLYPNPRGSTGYGEWWMRANMGDWGGGDYRDIMAGTDEVVKLGIADPAKLAFEGWSYGGYMTSWVVSQTQRFKAAMMGAGLPSLLSMAGTTDIPGYINTFFGDPQYDGSIINASVKKYLERSAISYSDRITTPLLILHGGSDERVPIGQPMEFYRALKDRGKQVELVFYPREGHGLSEYYHQADRMKREYEWIAQHTIGGAKGAVQP